MRAGGLTRADVVRLNSYSSDVDAFLRVADAWGGRRAAPDCRPMSTLLGVA
ncbi:MAG TPA: hypothetical protein VFO85_22435 [Vicinamibacteria bacterium]|nr:hypothetical protein [Vicinamibacteria bacterium]